MSEQMPKFIPEVVNDNPVELPPRDEAINMVRNEINTLETELRTAEAQVATPGFNADANQIIANRAQLKELREKSTPRIEGLNQMWTEFGGEDVTEAESNFNELLAEQEREAAEAKKRIEEAEARVSTAENALSAAMKAAVTPEEVQDARNENRAAMRALIDAEAGLVALEDSHVEDFNAMQELLDEASDKFYTRLQESHTQVVGDRIVDEKEAWTAAYEEEDGRTNPKPENDDEDDPVKKLDEPDDDGLDDDKKSEPKTGDAPKEESKTDDSKTSDDDSDPYKWRPRTGFADPIDDEGRLPRSTGDPFGDDEGLPPFRRVTPDTGYRAAPYDDPAFARRPYSERRDDLDEFVSDTVEKEIKNGRFDHVIFARLASMHSKEAGPDNRNKGKKRRGLRVVMGTIGLAIVTIGAMKYGFDMNIPGLPDIDMSAGDTSHFGGKLPTGVEGSAVDVANVLPSHDALPAFNGEQYPFDWAEKVFGPEGAMSNLRSLGEQAAADGHKVQWLTGENGVRMLEVDGTTATSKVVSILSQYTK